MTDGEPDDADEPEAAPDDERKRPQSREERIADALERVAFKLQDFGNWLLGFIR